MKSINNNIKLIAISVVTSLVLVGCGGSSDSSTTSTVKSTVLSGTAIDPEIQGANVYLDANDNGQYDEGELNTTTDSFGKYSLTIPEADIGKQIIVEGGIDRVTKESFKGKLRIVAKITQSGQFITPLTTIVEQYKEVNPNKSEDEVRAELATKLGLADVEDLDRNILDDTQLLKAALQINKVAQKIADATGKDIDEVYKKLAENLTDKDFDTAIQDTIDNDLNQTSFDYDRVKDLAKELKNLDHSVLNAEEFALTVDNIDRNITATQSRIELEDDLFDDDTIIISGTQEAKELKVEKALEHLGYEDLDDTIKQQLLDSDKIDFDDDSLLELKEKIENNAAGLDDKDMKDLDREKLFNESRIKDLDDDDKDELRKKFESDDFDFSTLSKDDLEKRIKDKNFLQSLPDALVKALKEKFPEIDDSYMDDTQSTMDEDEMDSDSTMTTEAADTTTTTEAADTTTTTETADTTTTTETADTTTTI